MLEFGDNNRTATSLFFGDNQVASVGSIAGDVTLSVTPEAAFVVNRYHYVATWATAFITPAATRMAYKRPVGSITGDTTISVAVAAGLTYTGEFQQQITGDVTFGVTPEADFAINLAVQRYDLVGEVTIAVVPEAAFVIDLRAHGNVLGSLTLEIIPGARLANSARWAFEEPVSEITWTFEAGA